MIESAAAARFEETTPDKAASPINPRPNPNKARLFQFSPPNVPFTPSSSRELQPSRARTFR